MMTGTTTADGGAAAATFVDASIEGAERAAERCAQRGDEGLEEETRLLRVLVRDRLRDGEDDGRYEAALRGLRVLIQAIKVRYGVSEAMAKQMGDKIEQIVLAFDEQMQRRDEDV